MQMLLCEIQWYSHGVQQSQQASVTCTNPIQPFDLARCRQQPCRPQFASSRSETLIPGSHPSSILGLRGSNSPYRGLILRTGFKVAPLPDTRAVASPRVV